MHINIAPWEVEAENELMKETGFNIPLHINEKFYILKLWFIKSEGKINDY